MFDFLTAPKLPRTSLSISETYLAMVELRARRGELSARNSGVTQLPAGLIRAHFTEPNITNEGVFQEHLGRVAEQASLSRVRKLMVTIPEAAGRSVVVSLENQPASRTELNQMLEWKSERNLGCKVADVVLSSRQLKSLPGKLNYLISAIHKRVLEQYEKNLAAAGMTAGVIMPQHMGEAQWLMRADITEDQVLASVNPRGFTVVVVRGDEPVLVRDVICSTAEIEDEFYRVMLFYRDRLTTGQRAGLASRLLVIGSDEEQDIFRRTLEAALEKHPVTLNAQSLGFNLEPRAPFNRLAAAAGLASLGC
ncbi:MAG: hypothetical protein ACKV2V_21945 [Blastocatellia bacterium]